MSIIVTLYDEDCEFEFEFPSVKEVCPECDGEGYVLCEGMRGYAYSEEEFNDVFHDEEDRQHYFKRGGKYDVVCNVCHGKNVIDVINTNALVSDEQKKNYKIYLKNQREEFEYKRICLAEMRMGC